MADRRWEAFDAIETAGDSETAGYDHILVTHAVTLRQANATSIEFEGVFAIQIAE